jgi:predicted Rossmann-fold nucleotide-binding protein
VALLNIDGFYDPLIKLLQHTVDEGFMRKAYLDILQIDADPGALIGKLQRYQPPAADKWAINRDAV